MLSDPASRIGLPVTQFYGWRGYRCAYELWPPQDGSAGEPLLLIHPIGVGLSRRFWDRFIPLWLQQAPTSAIYNPDLLGCGDGDLPRLAYRPEDWAAQMLALITDVIQRPVVVVAQGALSPVAVEMADLIRQQDASLIKGLVLSGPPSWSVVTENPPAWQQNLLWNLFDSPLGWGFYQYAKRRQFIQRFSARQLFAEAAGVDDTWLDQLSTEAEKQATRHAVFAFLAGFWRKDYRTMLERLDLPVLIVLGDQASSISRSGQAETSDQRLAAYLTHLSQGQGLQIAGRNVLPYESPKTFVSAIAPFIARLQTPD
jgi:pimeloyl-ACP methyl ester carboxylesterase